MKITASQIAEYIIESMGTMYEDGGYYTHYNPETGFNYKGNSDPENITVSAPCDYADSMSREEFDSKENLDDPDFMRICEELADKLNEEIENL